MLSAVTMVFFFFFSSRRRHTRSLRDWSSDVCSSDLSCIGCCAEQTGVMQGHMAQDETGSRTPAAASGERAARKQRIVAALSRGNFDQLDADVDWLLRQSPHDFDALKFAAVVALQRHDLSRAYGCFESARAAATDPASRALACAGLCEVLMAGGDALGAEPHAREALRLDAGNPEYHKLLARCHMGQGRVQEAITSMQRSIEALPPAFGDGLKLHLAGLMMQAGRAGDALAIVEALGPPVA